jgi:hypothetical protein
MRKLLIAVAFVSSFLAACADAPRGGSGGGDAGSTDLVAVLRQASESTFEAGSARITFAFEVAAAGQTQAMNGDAEIRFGDGDAADFEAHMRFEYPGFGSGVPGGTMEMILDGGPVIYLSADAFASMLPVETPWIKLDPATMGEGWDGMASFGGEQADPSSSFGFLYGAVEVEDLGLDSVDGEPATHYRATIDLEEALTKVPEAQRATLRKAIRSLREQAGGAVPELPMDVWIADGLLKRVSYELSMEGVAGTEGSTSVSATMTLSDIGAAFEIEPPPADQVTDMSDLAGMFGGASGQASAS